jgi:hypothetical protein
MPQFGAAVGGATDDDISKFITQFFGCFKAQDFNIIDGFFVSAECADNSLALNVPGLDGCIITVTKAMQLTIK